MDQSQNNNAMYCHLAFLATFFGSNLLAFLIVLIVWLTNRDTSDFVDRHGREALNLQITYFLILFLFGIASVIWFFFFFVAAAEAPEFSVFAIISSMGLVWVAFGGLTILYAVLSVVAALKARDGLDYQYPFVLRIL